MRRFFAAWTVWIATLILACGLWAQDFKVETHQLKERQKAEMKALKLKHKFAKQSLKGQPIAKSLRIQMENEMKREEQALRQKHDHELELLQDRQRVLREMQAG